MFKEGTIVSISTAKGLGAIGIIRVSGDKAFEIGERIFRGKKDFKNIKSHTINYGKIIDPKSEEILDEVMISKMKAPNTFTREDIIEINCHGGAFILQNVLDLVVRQGARIADPGEFTLRAFVNGRIDLSQAEAVIDIINSLSNQGAKVAIKQLDGEISNKISSIRNKLIDLIASIEVTVDYPEEDIDEITSNEISELLKDLKSDLLKLIQSYEKGKMVREGISIAIIGRPNVGKSSMLNKFIGKNKAIVTDIAGTTRDVIEEYITLDGIPVKIIDTAGIRETIDCVEKIGVDKAKKVINDSDFVLFLVDASARITDEDIEIYNSIKHKDRFIICNKIDLSNDDHLMVLKNKFVDEEIIETSTINETGIDELEKKIINKLLKSKMTSENEVLITNIRHKNLIEKSAESIDNAINAQASFIPFDLLTIDIKNSAQYLGEITGESVTEDVLKNIFSRFCLGK